MAKNGNGCYRWKDGRSGPAGQIAGEIVLEHLERMRGEVVRQAQGTVFISESAYWVGRSCGTDIYLKGGILHWANLSWSQFTRWRDRAQKENKTLYYLFVTATEAPVGVHYWAIPSDEVQRVFKVKGRGKTGEQLPAHIRRDGREHRMLREVVITPYHQEVRLSAGDKDRLARAQGEAREMAGADHRAGGDSDERGTASSGGGETTTAPASGMRSFEIPLARGGHVELRINGAMEQRDAERIKQWIDVMSDILTAT